MTNEEAIEFLYDIQTDVVYNITSKEKEALETAIQALEKQIPMKVDNRNEIHIDRELVVILGNCPVCKHEIRKSYEFCFKCGQALDWSEK